MILSQPAIVPFVEYVEGVENALTLPQGYQSCLRTLMGRFFDIPFLSRTRSRVIMFHQSACHQLKFSYFPTLVFLSFFCIRMAWSKSRKFKFSFFSKKKSASPTSRLLVSILRIICCLVFYEFVQWCSLVWGPFGSQQETLYVDFCKFYSLSFYSVCLEGACSSPVFSVYTPVNSYENPQPRVMCKKTWIMNCSTIVHWNPTRLDQDINIQTFLVL